MIGIDLSGRAALVTGASGGIGAGIARRLADAGADVVVHYRRDRAGAEAVARSVGGRTVGGDLTAEGAAARLLDETGIVDILVHNAADQRLVPLEDSTPGDWAEVFAVNVTAAAELTRELCTRLSAAGRGGSVVAVSSIEAAQPAPAHGVYSSSKAALGMAVRAMAAEFGPLGVRVNAVCPGLVDRPGLADAWPEGVRRWLAAVPLGRLGSPRDVGDAVAFLASDLAGWITGATVVVDGGVLCRPTW